MNTAKDQYAHQRKRHWNFIDTANVLSCFFVVCLHTSLPVFSPDNSLLWKVNLLVQATCISAVPMFLMISGMNLLGYREQYPTPVFFRKRAWRTGRALLLGSVTCYLVFGLFPHAFYGAQETAVNFGLLEFIKHFLTNSINDIYWFFYSILYLYMLTPIISRIALHEKTLGYALLLTALVSVAIPLLHELGINPRYTATILGWPLFSSSSLLYFMAGFYVHRYIIPRFQPNLWPVAITFLSSTALMFIFALLSNGWRSASGIHQTYNSYVISINSPLCVIQTLSLFLLLHWSEQSISELPHRILLLIRTLSKATLGVYLFHLLLVNQLVIHNPIHTPVLKAVVIYLITVAAVLSGQYMIRWAHKLIRGGANTR